jgi:hypothetical protein
MAAAASREIVRRGVEAGYRVDTRVITLIENHGERVWLWAESAVPFLFAVAKCLEEAGKHDAAQKLLSTVLLGVVEGNKPRGSKLEPFPSLYYSAETILLDQVERDPVRKQVNRAEFRGHSSALHSLVFLLARRGMRSELAALWKEISKIRCTGFEPAAPEGFWSFDTRTGQNRFGYIEAQQKWPKLVEAANRGANSPHAWPLWGRRLLWYFLVVPHRWNVAHACLVDGAQVGDGDA